MAYIDQERKKVIHGLLKEVMPKAWKWSLSITDHSTLNLNIREADVDLPQKYYEQQDKRFKQHTAGGIEEGFNNPRPVKYDHFEVHDKHIHAYFTGELEELFERIATALNHGNYNNSDSQRDYFEVGFYTAINIGRWNRPFTYKPSKTAKAA